MGAPQPPPLGRWLCAENGGSGQESKTRGDVVQTKNRNAPTT